MRFAHLADSHLGYKQLGLDTREQDVYDVFEKTIDKIIELDVDFVIHSGDLFDQSRPSTNALLVFQKGLLRLNESGIPIYAIAGNHDSVLRKNVKPPIALFEELGLNIIRIGEAFELSNIMICGIQYVPKSQKSALDEIFEEFSELAEEYEKSILVLHQGIDKVLPENAYELKLDEIPDNFNYYALGHIHDFHEIDYGKGKLVYPGSMEIHNITDTNKQLDKGFCVVDLTGEKPNVERIIVELPRNLINKTINYENLDEELEDLKNSLQREGNKPMLDLRVEGGEFNSADIYEHIQETLKEEVLNIRYDFRPDDIKHKEINIKPGETLDSRELLMKKIQEKYNDEKKTALSVDLLNLLSAKKIEDAQFLSKKFYKENYSTNKNSKVEE